VPLKFRLKGLAETFIDHLSCPKCRHDGGDEGDKGFKTELTRVTYDGIVVVVLCEDCKHVFVPREQRCGIINRQRLKAAVDRDSSNTGQPVFNNLASVCLDVERLNAERMEEVH
jgi:hypothetical protein